MELLKLILSNAFKLNINRVPKRLSGSRFKATLYFLVVAARVVNHSLCKKKGGKTTLLRYGFKGK